MFETVSVSHRDIFNLCSSLHSALSLKQYELNIARLHKSDSSTSCDYVFALERFVDEVQLFLEKALDIAPEDVKDFFLYYDEITATCPF